MIRYLISIVLFISFIPAEAQTATPEKKTIEPDFKNAGEQEDYWAKELFKRDYNKQHYERYKGAVVINGDTYRYNDQVLTVYTTPELKAIFQKGIFYPGIIAKSFKYRPKIKIRLVKDTMAAGLKKDTSSAIQKVFYDMARTDSLIISNLEELKFLNTMPKQRKFRFWLSRKGFANPTVYFFELTNENATSETGMSSFINGSKLTFFELGWIII